MENNYQTVYDNLAVPNGDLPAGTVAPKRERIDPAIEKL